jgi:hypothetical protein
MTYLQQLPAAVTQVIRSQFVAEWASISAAGVPIDTPLCLFPSADLTTLDVGTGLAYPTKAERARRNPKVGLLIEGGPDQPVVSVAGLAAVRDSNLQANLERYLAEGRVIPFMNPSMVNYDSIMRPAVWYFTRIIVCTTPVHIRWWKSPAAMDEQPGEWRAPANTISPKTDPSPLGDPSEAPQWSQPPWQELADGALARKAHGHLTLADYEGFPLPIRAREIGLHKDGFSLVMPKGVPWASGKATLSFEGREIFVGNATIDGGRTLLRVERALPVLPLTADPSQVLQPKPDLRARLMKRLEYEAKRRGQSVPKMPAQPPEPTQGAQVRVESAVAYTTSHPGSEGAATL